MKMANADHSILGAQFRLQDKLTELELALTDKKKAELRLKQNPDRSLNKPTEILGKLDQSILNALEALTMEKKALEALTMEKKELAEKISTQGIPTKGDPTLGDLDPYQGLDLDQFAHLFEPDLSPFVATAEAGRIGQCLFPGAVYALAVKAYRSESSCIYVLQNSKTESPLYFELIEATENEIMVYTSSPVPEQGRETPSFHRRSLAAVYEPGSGEPGSGEPKPFVEYMNMRKKRYTFGLVFADFSSAGVLAERGQFYKVRPIGNGCRQCITITPACRATTLYRSPSRSRKQKCVVIDIDEIAECIHRTVRKNAALNRTFKNDDGLFLRGFIEEPHLQNAQAATKKKKIKIQWHLFGSVALFPAGVREEDEALRLVRLLVKGKFSWKKKNTQ